MRHCVSASLLLGLSALAVLPILNSAFNGVGTPQKQSQESIKGNVLLSQQQQGCNPNYDRYCPPPSS